MKNYSTAEFWHKPEEWLPIKGYDGFYEVSDYGRVRNSKTGEFKALRLRNINKKYLSTDLYKDNKKKTVFVHRLVAEHFIQNPSNLETVDHVNFDKTDNCVLNLQWLSKSENNRRKYSPVKAINIKTGETIDFINQKLASDFTGVLPSDISRIVHGFKQRAKGWTFKPLTGYVNKGVENLGEN